MEKQDPLIKVGRPRLEVDYKLVLRLREQEHLGWSKGAEEYRKRTGQWISRDTFKRRYFEAKAASEPALLNIDELKVKVKWERTTEEEWNQIIKKLLQVPPKKNT